jgi:hypothetical protein
MMSRNTEVGWSEWWPVDSIGEGCRSRIFMPARATAGGGHRPRWPIGTRHLATLPLISGPHSASIFFFKYS